MVVNADTAQLQSELQRLRAALSRARGDLEQLREHRGRALERERETAAKLEALRTQQAAADEATKQLTAFKTAAEAAAARLRTASATRDSAGSALRAREEELAHLEAQLVEQDELEPARVNARRRFATVCGYLVIAALLAAVAVPYYNWLPRQFTALTQQTDLRTSAPLVAAQPFVARWTADLAHPSTSSLLTTAASNNYALRYETGRAILSNCQGDWCLWGINPDQPDYTAVSATAEVSGSSDSFWYVVLRAGPSLSWWHDGVRNGVTAVLQPNLGYYELATYLGGQKTTVATGRTTAARASGTNTLVVADTNGRLRLAVNGYEVANVADTQGVVGPGYGVGLNRGSSLVLSAFETR